MLTFPLAPNHVRTRHKASASKRKSTFFFRARNSTNWLFSNLPKILRARFQCMMSLTSPGLTFYLGFLFWHLWTKHTPLHSSLHQTNPCAKRKVLSLTKPKGRIYKTKSLGHYITTVHADGFSCARNVGLNHSHNSTVHAHRSQEEISIPTSSTCLVFITPVCSLMQMSPLHKIGSLAGSWEMVSLAHPWALCYLTRPHLVGRVGGSRSNWMCPCSDGGR